MGRKRTRRQQHGSAWHWQQTDCWYFTLPGTKNRLPRKTLSTPLDRLDNINQLMDLLARFHLLK
jgi:hypothetical protein